MKKTILVITSFLFIQQAGAQTAAEFSAAFVTQINHRLSITNQERKEQNKGLYCTQMSKQQVALIQKTAAKPNITVGEFVDTVGENLKCYPEFWSPWGRENIGGVLFNTKAFVMDTWIIHDVLEDLVGGGLREDTEPLLGFSTTDSF